MWASFLYVYVKDLCKTCLDEWWGGLIDCGCVCFGFFGVGGGGISVLLPLLPTPTSTSTTSSSPQPGRCRLVSQAATETLQDGAQVSSGGHWSPTERRTRKQCDGADTTLFMDVVTRLLTQSTGLVGISKLNAWASLIVAVF